MRRLVAVALAFGATLLAASPAEAFCRTWSCDPTRESCPRDPQNPDCSGGDPAKHKPLFWPQSCVGFSLNQNATRQLDTNPDRARAKFMKITDTAFRTWQQVKCSGESPSIEFADLGFAECDKHEYNQQQARTGADGSTQIIDGGNANLIVFREDSWPYAASNNVLALTTLTFNVKTGEIYDADMEINAFDKTLTTSDTGDIKIDLQAVITHEAGHFIGIAHSKVEEATMNESYSAGDIGIRSLHPDDVAAICAIYPPKRDGLPVCDPTPRHGYSTKCGQPVEEPSVPGPGCAIAAPSSAAGNVGLVGLAAALGLLASRRRRA